MRKIRRVGTVAICAIVAAGLVLVLLTVFFYGLNNAGVSNSVVSFFNQNADVDFRWKKDLRGKYEKFDKKKNVIERYEAVSRGIAGTVEDFCTAAIPGNKYIKQLVDGYKERVLLNTISGTVGGKTNEEYAREAVDDIEVFSEYLNDRGIDLIYIQTPNGVRMEACSLKEEEYPSEKLDLGDRFSEYLKETEIPFVNISLYEESVRNYSMDATNHWLPENGLDATKIVASELNEYGYRVDPTLFEAERYKNALELMPQTEDEIKQECGYDFYMPVPIESPMYKVDFFGTEDREGEFIKTLLADTGKWNEKSDTGNIIAYHNMFLINNGTYTDIINRSNVDGYRIVVLGDSFSWPIASYLSEGVSEVAYINPIFFNGDARQFVEYYDPDAVFCIFLEPKESVSFEWIY